jgi:hypothetical protein
VELVLDNQVRLTTDAESTKKPAGVIPEGKLGKLVDGSDDEGRPGLVDIVIDDMLRERGMQPRYMNGYRLTDRETMKVVVEAAGEARTQCEQSLSKVSLLR